VELVERLPTVDEFVGLLRRVGWAPPPIEDCRRALAGSLAAVCAVEREAIVGMGRLVGDGRVYCFAVDVVVAPDAQGRGIGRDIVGALEALATRRGLATRIDLVAAPDVVPFYERLGYSRLPSDLMRKPLPGGPAMRRVVP
jgi:GNAT superfamily N-acetyltransferase